MKGWFNAVVAQLVVITNGLILWIASFLIVVYVDWDRIVYCRGDACSGSVLRPEGLFILLFVLCGQLLLTPSSLLRQGRFSTKQRGASRSTTS